MQKFNPQILSDPIILIVACVAIAAIGILVWAVMNWKKLGALHNESDELQAYEDDAAPPPSRPMESSGVFEAQLQEITCQLTEISTRIETIDKASKNAPLNSDKTMNGSVSPEIESKLNNLEAKLDGIHKLLIALTDSGGSNG